MFVCDRAFYEQAKGLMERASVSVEVVVVPAGKFRRYSNTSLYQKIIDLSTHGKNTADLFKIIGGLSKSVQLLRKFRPDVVFAKGGYVCLPVGYAAKLLKIPLVIHDSDARPGLTNRLLARFASRIATGMPVDNYPSYDKKITVQTGVPIGDKYRIYSQTEQEVFREKYSFDVNRPLVVVTGGGLGAMSINRAMIDCADRLIEQGIQVFHVSGKKNYDKIRGLLPVDHIDYRLVPFVYEAMHEILAMASVVVSRGSATFTQELSALAKPVIMIPASNLGDQVKNAVIFQQAEAVSMLSDEQIAKPGILLHEILHVIEDSAYAQKISQNLHSFARIDAASKVAELVAEVAQTRTETK